MKNIFDTNARADEMVMGGEPAARAVGMPTQFKTGGTYAPGGSNATAEALIQQSQERVQSMLNEQPQTARQADAVVGYNPDTNEVFSQGKVFKLDLNEGRQNAPLFDADNSTVPQGFYRVRSSQLKQKLAAEYENLGVVDSLQRRAGQAVSNYGSTLEDLGAESLGQAMQQYGGDVAARNPSKITSASDIIDKPGTLIGETAGELGYDLPVAIGTTAVGAAAGAKAGAVLAPFTGGASVPIGAILGGLAGRFLPTLFETYGGVRSEQRGKGIDDKGAALAAGSGSAALEAIFGPEARIGQQLAKKSAQMAGKEFLEKGAAKNARDLLAEGAFKSFGKKAAGDFAKEGGTEIAQTGMERAGAYNELLSEDALNEYAIAGAKGGVGGAMASPLASLGEFQEAKNFVENLRADMEAAANPAIPSAARLQAAKRVQDVLRGSSDDPEFNTVLSEFRQKLAFIDTEINRIATAQALADGRPVNLLDTAPQQDLFNRGLGEQPAAETTSEEQLPLVTSTDPNQISMFDETGAPTYQADPNFGVSQLEAQQSFQGPTLDTPQDRFTVQARQLNDLMSEFDPIVGNVQGAPLTAQLTPLQRETLAGPQGRRPIGNLDLAGIASDINSLDPAPLTREQQQGTADPVAEAAIFGRPLRTVSPTADGRTSLQTPAGQQPAGGLSTQLTADDLDLGLGELKSEVASRAGAVTGPITLSQGRLSNVRNLLLTPNPNATVENDPEAKTISDAVRRYAKAFEDFQNAFANIKRFDQPLKGETNAAALKRANETVTTVEKRAAEAREALAALGKVVGGAKDVEALVRLVKDTIQPAIANVDPKTLSPDEKAYYDALKTLDQAFGRGWTAAKQDQFREGVDLFVSRSEDTRRAKEADGSFTTQLRKAYDEGYGNPNKTNRPENFYTGFLGILQYLRHHATGYDQLLARQIRDVLKNIGDVPNVVFLSEEQVAKGEKSRFDPKTNLIYIRETESPSVVLHEAMHAALQHFVYTNPNDPIVVELKKSLKAVIGYKGTLGAKAEQVRGILKGLVQKGNELDAVLELMSYGNTLNEFRKALESIPKKGTPKSFFDAVTDVWKYALALVRRLTGTKTNSEATAVIERTWELLAKTGEAPTSGKRKRVGNVLNADVVSGMTPVSAAAATLLQRPGASLPTDVNVAQFNKRVLPSAVSTKVLFDLIGWPKIAGGIGKASEAIADFVRDRAPGVAKWVTYLHAQFMVPHDLRNTFAQFKNDRQAGAKVADRLAVYIQYQPADKVTALFAYLDGDKNALKDDVATRELADDVKAWRDYYVQELQDEKAKKFFASGKFSETMLFASNREQVAGTGFGMRKLSSLLGQKTVFEKNLEPGWMNLDANGDTVLDGRFRQVFKNDNGLMVSQGFVAESKIKEAENAGFVVDPTYLWSIASKSKEGYKFVAQMTAAQAIKEQKAGDLSNALRNTMAALSGTYAAKHFADSVVNYGVDTNAKYGRDETSVVFDSIDQAEKVLKIKINRSTVLAGDSAEARTKAANHAYRSSHLWVKVPKGERYGAMSGKIIKASVWSALNDAVDRKPVVELELAGGAMRWFKKSKTVYNPGTHLTNVATNVTLAAMHDIPFVTVAKAAKLFLAYELNPNGMTTQDRALVRAFVNSNAMLGDFSSVEVKQALSDALMASVKETSGKKMDPDSTLGRVASFMQMEKNKSKVLTALTATKKYAGRADHAVTELYAAEDNIFRLALFLKSAADISAQTGKAPTQADLAAAGNMAREGFLDYDIDAKAVKIARQTVLPFVSWTYAIIPVISRMAVHQPWKIANVLLAYTVIEHLLQEMGGGDEEDERLRKVGPEYIRERMFFGKFGPYVHVRIPFLGDDNNPVYYRLGDYMPMTALTRGQGPNAFLGQEWWPSAATPTGPYVSAILAAVAGVDPYTGKPLGSPTDTQLETLATRARYLTSQLVLPPWASIDDNAMDKLKAVINQRTDRTQNFAALQMARFAGLKLYDYNVDQAAVAQQRAARAIMSEYKQEIGKLRRAEARFENPDWDAFMLRQDELLIRMREEMAKAKGEE